MITRPLMMAAASDTAYSFQYTVNTVASSSSDKKTGLPVNLYGQDGVVVDVDWGDGTTSTLTSASYTASDSTASVHTYASTGTYTVTATSKNWSDAYLLSVYADAAISSNNCNAPVYWWRRTLTGVVNALPPVKGVKGITGASATAYTARDNDLGFLFHRCEKMTSLPASLFANCGHIQIFNSTFYNCIALPSLPAGLFDPCVSATSFSDCFRYCTALTSIPVSFFKYCTAATNMYNVFRFCNKVPSVPADLFRYNTLVTNMGGAFSKCDALKNFTLCIGSPNVATVTDFIPNASGVTRIVCVPANSTTYTSFNAYKNTSNNVTVSTDNADCGIEEEEIDDGTWKFTVDTEATASGEKKTGIPFNLYGQTGIELTVDWGDNTTSTLTPSDYTASDSTASVHEYAATGEYTVTVASNDWENTYLLFYDSSISSDSYTKTSSLYWFKRTATSIDTKLPQIKGVANANTLTAYDNSLQYLFCYLEKLTSIPSGLFDKNTALDSFDGCFKICSSLASIPSGLFDKNTAVTSFYCTFFRCSSLASIPSGLFDKNTAVTDFQACFSNCSSLVSIPSGLFDKNTAVTTFYECFRDCSSLQSIPSGLFDKNTAVTRFDSCFQYCSSLASIPSGLFDKNTAVTRFDYCFMNCTSLQSIPSELFDKNIAVTSFSTCFRGCTSLLSIPAGLFDKNTAVTSFASCFSYCSLLQSIPSGLFGKNTAVTTLYTCFQGCTNLLNFHLKIGSSSVNTFTGFIPNASNVDRILCVPANSTTYTIASSYANSSNNIIVSTDFINCAEAWEFTIDTEATASGEKKTGIPFNLYGQTGIELLVDWGDNTTSRLTPSDYTASDSTASVHEYAAAGEYDVTVISNNWENTYIYTATITKPANANPRIPSNNNYCNMLYWSTRTFIALTNPIPQIKGVKNISIYNGSSPSGDSVTSSAYTSNNSINSIFAYYQKIQTISVNLFQKIPFTNFGNIFYYCTSLQSIPSELFNNNSAATSFVYSFANCTSLQSIPTGLFDNTSANNFDHCFYNCTSLTSIPSGLFDKNTEVTSAGFRCVFCNCTSLQSIPSGLFDKNTKVTDFLAVFYGCTSLASIPSGLFDKNTKVAGTFGFSECFRDCTSLTSIPSGLFDKNTNVTRFSECFSGCTSLASIPSGLFDKNTKAVSFDSVFYGCTSLASIPSGLFDKNTAAVTFDGCFAECTSLQSIPSGLFNKNTAATTFGGLGYYQGCFRNCTSLQSIPSGLFDNNTAVTTFQNCFYGCTSLQSIPSGLFDNNTAVTNFGNCFSGCSHLQSIPSRLFDKNTAAVTFDGCFAECTSFASIPSGLFNKNTAVINFGGCFSGCTNLLNFHLKIGSSSVTTFTNFIPNASNVDRILCVPANSTTYTNASSFANASNGVIVSTDYIDCAEAWEFTIDTEASASGERTTGIPFYLYGQDGIELLVDWGDNTTSRLSPSDYTENNSAASLHEYASAGEYTVTIYSTDWENTYLLATTTDFTWSLTPTPSNENVAVYWFRRTVTSIDTALPTVKGIIMYSNANLTASNNSFAFLFQGCTSLTSIPAGLLSNNIDLININSLFAQCTSLASIPSRLFDSNTKIADRGFHHTFEGCTSLISIPAGLFDNNTLTTRFDACFKNCTSLQSIPSGLFDKNTNVTNFMECFMSTGITSIPAGLFDKNTKVITFGGCFYGCASLASIPAGLFDKNTAVRNNSNIMSGSGTGEIPIYGFNECFKSCSSLVSIPKGLFDNNTKIVDFYYTFANCTALANIPNGLFKYQSSLKFLDHCFYKCTSLLTFHLLITSTNLTSMDSFIPNASNVDRIICVPASSTTYTTANSYANSSNNITVSTDLLDCPEYWEFTIDTEAEIAGNKKSGIPFILVNDTANVTLLVDWGDGTSQRLTKSNYTAGSLTPVHTYGNYRASTHTYANAGRYTITVASSNWNETYLYCISMTNLIYESDYNSALWWYRKTLVSVDSPFPEIKGVMYSSSTTGEVDYNPTYNNNSFIYAFYNCQYLQTIPSNLFYHNSAATSFKNCFSSCNSLQSIPSGLFDKNTQATDFSYCFSSCNSLQSIPSGLFDKNTRANLFLDSFSACINLLSIPSGLFDKNTAVTRFYECFRNCSSLASIPSGLFDKNTAANDFYCCFQNCTSLGNFTLNIGSSVVSICSSFVTLDSNATRIINVPANSATYTAFSNVASDLGLTIVGV